MPDGSTEFGASNNNLRQMPDVKGELEARVGSLRHPTMRLSRVRFTTRPKMVTVLIIGVSLGAPAYLGVRSQGRRLSGGHQ